MDNPLPADLRRFILISVPSVAYLEAMLQFHRLPQTRRSAASLAVEIYVSDSTATALIGQLETSGVISAVAEAVGLFVYAPTHPGLDALHRPTLGI
jgi:hypothetical protein